MGVLNLDTASRISCDECRKRDLYNAKKGHVKNNLMSNNSQDSKNNQKIVREFTRHEIPMGQGDCNGYLFVG